MGLKNITGEMYWLGRGVSNNTPVLLDTPLPNPTGITGVLLLFIDISVLFARLLETLTYKTDKPTPVSS